jgi:hypothetical protein
MRTVILATLLSGLALAAVLILVESNDWPTATVLASGGVVTLATIAAGWAVTRRRS